MGPVATLRARAEYAWHFGEGRVAALRSWWDAGVAGPFERTVSAGTPAIAYAGLEDGLTYVLPFLERQRAAVRGDPAAEDTPEERPADIVVVGCSTRHAARLPGARSLVLPFRVNLVLPIEGDAETMLRGVSANERRTFARKRRENAWELAENGDPAGLRFFYERMHRPTMEGRHGEHARSVGWDVAYECLFKAGRLFFVTERGEPVAGVLCRFDPASGMLTMRLLGVLDGDGRHYASGAVKAAYYLVIEWACRNGVRSIDFSGGEPFLSKGVFQFKRRFHPTVVLPRGHFGDKRLWLHVARDGDAVRDFLVANPCIAMGESGLEAVYFHDRDRPARTDLRAGCPGVTATRFLDLDVFL